MWELFSPITSKLTNPAVNSILNTMHTDSNWNVVSRKYILLTAQLKFVHMFMNPNSCLTFGPRTHLKLNQLESTSLESIFKLETVTG